MSHGPVPFRAETLIEHHDFVLGLAKSLVRDAHEASDVAQETWLSALTHSPSSSSGPSLRTWLARVARSRALDRARHEEQRSRRERIAARRELDDSDAELRERVALAHEVVEAVLALPEPARSVILLYYYEGLSAAEIARQRTVPAGTVRAQISRALDLLRQRLDARHGGRRDAWSVGLMAIAARGSKSLLGANLALAGAVVAAIAIPIAIWQVGARDRAPRLDGGSALAVAASRTTPLPPEHVQSPADLVAPIDAHSPAIAASRSPAVADPIVPEEAQVERKQAASASVVNGDFEAAVAKDGSIPEWTVAVGATNGAEAPVATVKIDTKEKHGGRASLLLSGDDTTRGWRYARHELVVRPGGTYRLSAWTKAEKVRQETVRGTDIRQFQNCWVGLFVLDANGEIVAQEVQRPGMPTSSWQKLSIDLVAPETVRRAYAAVSLTMSGSLWVDDLEISIQGGTELPPRETVAQEDFEKSPKLPPGWEEEVGAHNGNGSSRNAITVDKSTGAAGSHASLHFSGNRSTIQWYTLGRKLDVAPGDAISFHALAKAKDVRKEGIQFANLHINLSFLDANDKPVGAPKFTHAGDGTFDWKELWVLGVAPEGAVKARAGIFLSMSGDAWFDDLEITRQGGNRPPYADWLSHETAHLLVRCAKDNPRAAKIEEYGKKLDDQFEHIVEVLGVDFTDRVTFYIYSENEQGKNLTGRNLDFSQAENKVVHQRWNSTLGHEMVHCIALKLGHAQKGILGEGLAVYLNGDPPEEHHKHAARLLATGTLPSMSSLLDAFEDQSLGYPAAGSFCGYLIETYGIDKFKELYPSPDPSGLAERTLGKSFAELDKDWRAFLQTRS